jgi:hypothetical protein
MQNNHFKLKFLKSIKKWFQYEDETFEKGLIYKLIKLLYWNTYLAEQRLNVMKQIYSFLKTI